MFSARPSLLGGSGGGCGIVVASVVTLAVDSVVSETTELQVRSNTLLLSLSRVYESAASVLIRIVLFRIQNYFLDTFIFRQQP